MEILWGSITLTSSLWRQRSCPSGPWVMPPCLTLEQLPCFLSTWSCPLSAPRVYSRAPALPVGGQGWAEGQAGGLTPWKWTLLPHAPPGISIAPEHPPPIPRALPALAISPLLTSPRPHSPRFSPCVCLAPPTSGLSPPLAAGAPRPGTHWGGVWDRWQHTVPPPQLCLCPSLTSRSTPQPFQEVSSPGTIVEGPTSAPSPGA